ncbi:MAG: ATP-grasp domain-containing protein [Solirubrobacterales bacterium]|nr:ATP-grasp domain-containing protein [Solirubrobacterales bacterium]MBV9807881.1 ATP-grasp domain-containing protein [Solirubrobacterales bacterium]
MKRIKRVFVANRGEIALRIISACRELGIESVVGTSDADRDGLAAREADRAVCLGPPPAAQSYLRDDLVVQAALGTGCDAIHPGYGFLAESPKLAARAREHGLTFVGPPAEVIELSGDKLRAREEASRAGVPILPGQETASADEAREVADTIGYPLLVKAAGGGGGRGIKLARDADELDRLLSLARSEAGAAFGDDRVYLERFIATARHVEVQIAADEHDAVVHLGERDCSVQRRYQKVIEEAPAPGLEVPARAAIHDAAVRFARAIGYRNLGTVEFVVDSETGEHYFLEINCRIQVEHPVTEAVTGRDLVALQLHVAAGRRLGFGQEDVVLDGHAIECRLNAEDVAHGFMPSPGTLSLFSVPESPGLRVDTHCFPGAVIPPYYDSLMAKLIAHAGDRDAAIDALIDALEDLDVEGVETNRTLLISVLGHDDFRRGAVTTDWLERAIV